MVQLRQPWIFQELFNEMDRWARGASASIPAASSAYANLESNVQIHENEATVELELPGVRAEDLEVEVRANRLRIRAKRDNDQGEQERSLQRERGFGDNSRELRLPWAVQEDQVKAEFKDGLLQLTLPKAEAAKARRIDVN